MVAAGTPVIAAAHSGVLSARWDSSRAGQSVKRSRYSRSACPSRNSTCISAHASAPSVPGRRHTRRSACFAVACRYTSMHTIFAPRSRRALSAWVITLTWVLAAFVPQMITRSDFAISRGSAPARRPVPAMNPFQARVVQIVEYCPEYCMTWRRRLIPSRCTSPMVPA